MIRGNELGDGGEAEQMRHDGIDRGVHVGDVEFLAVFLDSAEDGGDVEECGVAGDEESEGHV